jgi:hypothetical protein
MTTDKMRQTIEKYISNLKQSGIEPVRHSYDTLSTSYPMQLQHCHWMLERMQEMVEQSENPYMFDTEKELQKVNRWLGFIQGVFWSQSIYTIEQLKGDNRNAPAEI